MSSEGRPHLELNKRDLFIKKSRNPPIPKKMNINQNFYDNQVKRMKEISGDFKIDKEKYSKYFKPHLIFKIKLHAKPSETFRKNLKTMGINTISSSLNNLSYWVVFTDDLEFKKMKNAIKFRIKKNKNEKFAMKEYGTHIDYIISIEPIPARDKFRQSIKNKPLHEHKFEYLDVEIWRMDDDELDNFIYGFTQMINEKGGSVEDKLKTKSFCVLRIHANAKLINEVAQIREVAYIDRPPQIKLERKLAIDIENLDIQKPTKANLPGILILDSGILKHPILEHAIVDSIQVPNFTKTRDDSSYHGTQIASIALYGDIRKHIDDKHFQPQVLLYSAKIMREENNTAIFSDVVLLETQLKNAIEKIVEKYSNCRTINISFGDSNHKINNDLPQFRLASLIDELANKYDDIIFCIAVGNTDKYDDDVNIKNYPDYFLSNTDKIRIIDPATSVHGITVGSSYPDDTTNVHNPSSFTRIGPGLSGMIKPELIENGGNDDDLITANPNWQRNARLFTLDHGSSFSAPMVAHQIALLKSAFPNGSRNLIKALLISSATIPSILPGELKNIKKKTDIELQKLLNIYGYGKPNLNNSINSESKRVILKHTGSIKINEAQLFTVQLPEDFIIKKGKRSIEITMVFDPPTDSKRLDYIGVSMEYHLFKNSDIPYVRSQHAKIINEDSNINKKIRNEITMHPGVRLRSKSIHQKSTISYSRKPQISNSHPLILMVICKKKWLNDDNHTQNYAIIMSIKHENVDELYGQIKSRNQIREKTRARS